MEGRASFPADWIGRGDGAVATDLDLAVLLVNTLDLLEDPADRLTDLAWFTDALGQVGHRGLADALSPGDLPGLRELRDVLRSVFEAVDVEIAITILNRQLVAANAVFLLASEAPQSVRDRPGDRPGDRLGERPGDGRGIRFTATPDRQGLSALAARLPAALATYIAEHGLTRLGVCRSDPCRCAFVDRTRAGTRRYCCVYCNDRYAARAYRRRQGGGAAPAT